MDKLTIERYYDKTQPFYRLFWHRDSGSYALHCGFWDSNTKSLHEALLNQNHFLAEQVRFKPHHRVRVLDAGCGIGGSSIWLAKHYGAKVTGISLSRTQAQVACALADSNNTASLSKFCVMDYLELGFPANTFDVVWAIESICHAENKKDFVKEAYRVLKPKGKLIISDAFLKRETRIAEDERVLRDFLRGFVVPNLATRNGFEKALQAAGFNNVKYWDKTEEIKPSSKRMYVMCLMSHYFFRICHTFTAVDEILRNSVLAGIAQHKAVKNDLCAYLVFYAEK